MKILESFIQEYNQYLLDNQKVYDDNLHGVVKKVKEDLTQEQFFPSKELSDVLNKLLSRTKKPMKVAIVGQFSSGKTTFINALLSNNILPTGITPVTSKVNYIEYGTELKLKVTYNSGAQEYHSIDNISQFTDQRKNTVDIKFLTLFAPFEILKDIIFVDTPGLNSQSQNDTDITHKVLQDVDGILWLTLLDNAGKQSEEKVLKRYMKSFKDKSLCILNQKDKFSQEEIKASVSYVKETFKDYFVDVIPISAKQALDANIKDDMNSLENSNMGEVLNFIDNNIRPKADELKSFSIKKDLRGVCDILIKEYETIATIYSSLLDILNSKEDEILTQFDTIYKIYQNEFLVLENSLESILEHISSKTYQNIKRSKKDRYETQKKFLGEKIIKHQYEISILDSDHTINQLFYQNDDVEKMFKSIINMIADLECDISRSFDNVFTLFSSDIVKWQNTYKLKQKQRAISSYREFSDLRHFAAETYERILLSYHDNLFENTQGLSNKLEFLRGAIAFSYKQNTIVTINHFEKQIKESIVAYEKDPQSYSLMIPKEEDILTMLKTNFAFEQFQNNLTHRRSYLSSVIKQSKESFKSINIQKQEMVKARKDKYLKKADLISKIKNDITE